MEDFDNVSNLPHVQLDKVNNRIRDNASYAERGVLTLQKYKLLMEMKTDPQWKDVYVITEEDDLTTRKYRIRYNGVEVFFTKIPKSMVERYEKDLTSK